MITSVLAVNYLIRYRNEKEITFGTFYYDYVDREKPNTLFQNLYNWIREIERFAHFHQRIGQEIRLKSHYIITAYDPYIKIEYPLDTPISIQMSFRDITEFKNRLLEYTKEHKIRIRL